MARRGNANDSNLEALRSTIRTSLTTTYTELGLQGAVVSALAGMGRVNRGVIVYAIGSAHADRKNALSIATSTEMMHRGAVIIDDIEDDDTVRRGRPCLHVLVGQKRALAIADLLVSSALRRFDASGSQYLGEVLATYKDMSKGQALDVGALRQESIDVDGPAKLKTGSLIKMCFRLGARVAGLPDGVVAAYGEIGMHLGCAFQLQNDVNNFIGGEARNNEVRSDLVRGNLSSIVVAARMSESNDKYSLDRALTRVKALRDTHIREAHEILYDKSLSMPDLLTFVIRDFAIASDFVGDQVELPDDGGQLHQPNQREDPSDS